jgi:hypothetical protein
VDKAELQGELFASDILMLAATPWKTGETGGWWSAFDTDRDQTVSPLDVLLLVNSINSKTTLPQVYVPWLDVDRDVFVGPLDVLAIINQLNGVTFGQSPFLSLTMTNTGEVDGFTSDLSIQAQAKSSVSEVYLSLNGGVRRDVTSHLQPDGKFSITDEAIRQLYGTIPDGDNIFTLEAKEQGRFALAMDRRVTVGTIRSAQFQLLSTLPAANSLHLQWSESEDGVEYEVFVKSNSDSTYRKVTKVAGRSVTLSLTPANYSVYVEAVDLARNRIRSQTVSVVVP